MNEDQIKVQEDDSNSSSQTTPSTPPPISISPPPPEDEEEKLLASPVKPEIVPEIPSPIEPLLGDDQQSLEMKLRDIDSKQNLRLYLMKSWNVMQSAGNVPELSNSEIRKLLMSPPQSPSINSTSKEAATSASAPCIEEQLDSTNESDTLVMALDDDDEDGGGGGEELQNFVAPTTTTLKTLNPPLNDGIYTYWAVVKAQSTSTAAAAAGSMSSNNYLAKINFGRYLSVSLEWWILFLL